MRPLARSAFLALTLGSLAACGSWRRVGDEDRTTQSTETLTRLFNVQAYYASLGRLAAGEPLPFVGSIAFAQGPRDSTIALLGLSLENRALSFQREGNGFVARYRVDVTLQGEGRAPISVNREELVRVATFQETQRAEESVLFQQTFRLEPGSYLVTAALRDPATGSTARAELTAVAPSFGTGSTTAPILVYQARGRGSPDDTLSLVLNPRGSIGFGSDTLLAYVEGYGFAGPTRVPIEMITDTDSVLFRDSLSFRGGQEVESQVLKLRPDSLALGALRLAVGEGNARREVAAVVSFSSAWVVTNYDEMLDLLRYFGEDRMLDSIREAPEADRPMLWRAFWRETDPDRSTPENEALNTYFSRLAVANQRYRGEGIPGWRTDRGEVYVTVGEPDETFETSPGQVGGRVLRWNYINLRMSLLFHDETGFGRYRLTPSSRAEFERVVSRLRRLNP
ncbi:MAG TPA: GWxTD domain-containing protein [Gemmatimonadales bacterium]